MVFFRKRLSALIPLVASLSMAMLLTSCVHKKYENPITKDTQQPDKVLFDKAIGDIEHGRYEIARLTLNTMINTYDTSEYLAKAKLAVADSWYREGGAHGLAQAEAEYKDFILFYPQMEESAESQWKVCQIHFKQMEKADRDPTQAQRAEDECRQVLVQFPNSKYVDRAKQMLREVQEDLATKEFLAGTFYHSRQAFPAASARLSYVVNQYPLFSQADEALWELADSYTRLGDRWENQAADAYTRIVKDYPLSLHADDAAAKLKAMNRPVPAADPAALAHMKYEQEHYTKASLMSHVTAPLKEVISHSPDLRTSAKSGNPSMETMRPPTPISVPATITGAPGISGGEVSVAATTNTTDIDSKPDARAAGVGAPAVGASAVGTAPAAASTTASTPPVTNGAAAPMGSSVTTGPTTATAAAPAQAPLPTNYQTLKIKQKKVNPKKKKQPKNAVNSPASPSNPTPNVSNGTPAAPVSTDTTTPKTDSLK